MVFCDQQSTDACEPRCPAWTDRWRSHMVALSYGVPMETMGRCAQHNQWARLSAETAYAILKKGTARIPGTVYLIGHRRGLLPALARATGTSVGWTWVESQPTFLFACQSCDAVAASVLAMASDVAGIAPVFQSRVPLPPQLQRDATGNSCQFGRRRRSVHGRTGLLDPASLTLFLENQGALALGADPGHSIADDFDHVVLSNGEIGRRSRELVAVHLPLGLGV